MSVVYGNIRYFAFYKSLEELRQDSSVRDGCLVSVIDTNNVDVDYRIETKLGDNGIRLNSGLYANPIYNGNRIGEGISQIYSSIRPVDYPVGGVNKGDFFQGDSITEVFDRIFNGTEKIVATVSATGWDPNIVIPHGQLSHVTYVMVFIFQSYNPVELIRVSCDGEIIAEYPCSITTGSVSIPVEIVKRDSFSIDVEIIDSKESSVKKTLDYNYTDPIYYSVVSPSGRPSPFDFPDFDSHMTLNDLSTTKSFSNQRFCVAVPINKQLEHIYDENNLLADGAIQDDYYLSYDTSFFSINYHFYLLKPLTVSNYTFNLKFKEA